MGFAQLQSRKPEKANAMNWQTIKPWQDTEGRKKEHVTMRRLNIHDKEFDSNVKEQTITTHKAVLHTERKNTKPKTEYACSKNSILEQKV